MKWQLRRVGFLKEALARVQTNFDAGMKVAMRKAIKGSGTMIPLGTIKVTCRPRDDLYWVWWEKDGTKFSMRITPKGGPALAYFSSAPAPSKHRVTRYPAHYSRSVEANRPMIDEVLAVVKRNRLLTKAIAAFKAEIAAEKMARRKKDIASLRANARRLGFRLVPK